MKLVTGEELGRKFCEIMGLDFKEVHSISIIMVPNKLVEIRIKSYIKEGWPLEIMNIYNLVKKDNGS